MKRDEKKQNDKKVAADSIECEENTKGIQDNKDESCENVSHESNDIENLKEKLNEKTKKCEEYFELLQRTAAEFDNYKKRTVKEKDALYSEATSDAIASFLPVVDNIERAVQAAETNGDIKSLKDGIELVYRQFKDVMQKLGVEEIKCLGESFDPNLHNAVMHIEDDSCGENVVVDEFQKGYILKDKVIRHSMVKVAN